MSSTWTKTTNPFEIQQAGVFHASYLAEVVSVKDEEHLSRVQVRLLGYDGIDDQDGPVWARVAVPFAGADRGAFMIPDVGDEVLVTFINGDSRFPVVVGGLWNGNARPKETLGGAGDRVDRWSIIGKAGTRIAIVEETQGQETILLQTPTKQVSAELTDAGGGKVEIKVSTTTITIDTGGVTVTTPSNVKVQATQVEVTAPTVKVNAALSQFSGMVMCDTLNATTVIATTYTPGAGNIW